MNIKKLIPTLLISSVLISTLSFPISASTAPANYYTSIAKERTTDSYNNSSKYTELDAYGEYITELS